MADPSKAVIIPAPPRAPQTDDAATLLGYRNQLNRWLDNFSRVFQQPFYLRGTGLFFPPGSLGETGFGLRTGEVFVNLDNHSALTIVRDSDVWMPTGGVSATTGLGTLTVSV